MMSLDTETTGRDLHHGAKPFIIISSDEEGKVTSWEWHVDPLTREPVIPEGDLDEVAGYLFGLRPIVNHELVFQNAKFDFAVLDTINFWGQGIVPSAANVWPDVNDTIVAGHLLYSNRPHNLTDMVLEMVGQDIEPWELRVKAAVTEARKFAKQHLPGWMIAREGLPCMPSVKASANKKEDKLWKNDMWLPRAVASKLGDREPDPDCEHVWDGDKCRRCRGHRWWVVTREYAETDAVSTLLLWKFQRRELERRKLWEIYLERMKVIPIAYEMEKNGVTVNRQRLEELRSDYRERSVQAGSVCLSIADGHGYELELPKTVNGSVTRFVFDVLKLPVVAWTDGGNPSLGKDAMDGWLASLPERSKQLTFIRNLKTKRQHDTALTYMDGYERFWVPLGIYNDDGEQLWYRLYPSLNPTGTDTLRWSSSSPNEQNISKKEDFNLRYCFGPAPGREWWSLDAKNIELRLPAYESGEPDLIKLFEAPDEPPFYGSEHLLNFSVVYPEIWERELREVGVDRVGPHCKKKYESTWYKWCKNGDFAVGYQAGDKTADRAFHRPGSRARLIARFTKKEALNRRWVQFASKHGYVETMPDRTVCPDRGYPLLCTRSERGEIVPTIPLNYHIQGTAMWWTMKAMIRCDAQLEEWRRQGYDGRVVMQVHDEMVFDLPKRVHPKADPKRSNLGKIRVLQKLMEEGGNDLGIPTPVGVEFNETTWSEGVVIC